MSNREWASLGLLAVLGFASLAENGAAQQDSSKGTLLFVLTRQGKIPDAEAEGVQFEVTKAPGFELLIVEVSSGKLADKNSYLGRYYEHPVRREGKKTDFAVYAKVQLKPQTKLTSCKLLGERMVMKFFSGPIGTVNPNPADKKLRPDMDSFYVYQVTAFDPK
jgi:hypothetical protein